MKKMYTLSKRQNPTTGKVEDSVSFCQKAQRMIATAFVNNAKILKTTESALIIKHSISTSALANFKKADQDREMLMSGVENFAQACGFDNAASLLTILDNNSKYVQSNKVASDNVVAIDTQKLGKIQQQSGKNLMYPIGKGAIEIKNGKTRIVLHDISANISIGSNGETIVDLN